MRKVWNIFKYVILAVFVLFVVLMYMVIQHPDWMMNNFDGPSQQQINKEWNQPAHKDYSDCVNNPDKCYSGQ